MYKLKFTFLLLLFIQAPEFPEFTAKVQEAIISLGGSVFPKLNWSAPRVRMLTPLWQMLSYRIFCFLSMLWKEEEPSGSDKRKKWYTRYQ